MPRNTLQLLFRQLTANSRWMVDYQYNRN